jgi:tricorn protease
MDGGNVRKVTDFDDFDVLWPSSDRRRVVFEQGGYLWLHDPGHGDTRRIPIEVRGDRPHTCPLQERHRADRELRHRAARASARCSARAARSSRCPAQHGEIRNISRTPGGARNQRGLVAGRPVDRLPVRRHRRVRALRPRPGRQRRAAARHPRRQRVALPAGVVARFEAPRLRRQRQSPPRRRGRVGPRHGRWTRRATPTIPSATSPSTCGRRTASGSPTPRSTRATTARSGFTRCATASHAADARRDQRAEPGLRPAGPLPLFHVDARLEPGVLVLRVQLPLQQRHAAVAATLAADGPALNRPRSDEVGRPGAAGPRQGRQEGRKPPRR